MATHVITSPANPSNPASDRLYQMQMEHAARVDPTETFKTEQVKVKAGTVNLKYAWDSPYAFAVFADNAHFQEKDRAEWDAIAKDALEKFAAVKSRQIKFGPRPEDNNRYNHMIECDLPIDFKPETIEHFRKLREAHEEHERKQKLLRDLGIDPAVAAAQAASPYKSIGG